jgi:hypothetical protein
MYYCSERQNPTFTPQSSRESWLVGWWCLSKGKGTDRWFFVSKMKNISAIIPLRKVNWLGRDKKDGSAPSF